MNEKDDRVLRNMLNETINEIQSAGLSSPTERAYIFKNMPGVIYSPDESRSGQIRSLKQANRVRLQMGLDPLTAGEYRMELKALSTMPQLSVDAIRDYHARQISEYLNKDIPLTAEQKQKVFDIVGKMTDKELSELIKSYGNEGHDYYANVHKWLSDNILGDNDK